MKTLHIFLFATCIVLGTLAVSSVVLAHSSDHAQRSLISTQFLKQPSPLVLRGATDSTIKKDELKNKIDVSLDLKLKGDWDKLRSDSDGVEYDGRKYYLKKVEPKLHGKKVTPSKANPGSVWLLHN